MEFVTDSLRELETELRSLDARKRLEWAFDNFPPEQILVTTSFGIHSALLLWFVSELSPGHPVHFIDTGFHFEQTLAYKEQLVAAFGLHVVEVGPSPDLKPLCEATRMWQSSPNVCCYLNKVAPLEPYKQQARVWISGVMGFQNRFRKQLPVISEDPSCAGLLKLSPFIDWTQEQYEAFRAQHDLPVHPLQALGYGSVGCIHCTSPGSGRSGRWSIHFKTECGLHTGSFGTPGK
ncbi:MAG: phosphoadenylyl-sulfate reductase [Saprospiraceae bacterium]|nr:MAG: phosphoadenylyl-sulfate reductase [Saprospiraceae bacterium]